MEKDKDDLKPNKSKKTMTGQPASEVDPHPVLDNIPNINKGKTSDTKFSKKSANKGMQNEMVERILERARKMKGKDPCWSGYRMVGQKTKNGRKVPNCVPKESYLDLSEVAGAGPVEMDQLVRLFMGRKNNEDIGRGMDNPSYTKMFSDAMQHYVKLLQDAKNKGKPWEQVAKTAASSFPEITPYGLFTGLKEILGIGDSAVKNRIVDEATKKMTARERFKAGLARRGYNVDDRHAEAERYDREMQKKHAETMARYANDKSKVDEESRLNEVRRKSAASLGFLRPDVKHGVTASSEPYGDKHLPVVTTSSGSRVDIGHKPYPTPELAQQGAQTFIDHTYTSQGNDPTRGFPALGKHHQTHGLQKEARELVAMPYATGFISDSIVKLSGNKFRLVSKKSGRNLGTYPSRAGAEKRERQVQYFKHANEGRIITPRPTKLTDKGVSDTSRPVQYTPKPATNNARNVSVLTPRPGSNNEEALGKIHRTSGGPKKFMVKVKDPSTGNVKTVRFGDPNMSIKRDDPKRRASFRARHHCDTNPGPRTKARYWSCRQWRSSSKVEG